MRMRCPGHRFPSPMFVGILMDTEQPSVDSPMFVGILMDTEQASVDHEGAGLL